MLIGFLSIVGTLLCLVDFYMIYLLHNLRFEEVIFQNSKLRRIIARLACYILFVVMLIRSLSEGPGRMGTEYAEIIWGSD